MPVIAANPQTPARRLVAAAVAASFLMSAAIAQNTPATPAQPPATPAPAATGEPESTPNKGVVTLGQLPPPIRLGARATLLRRSVPIADALVIVPSDAAYAAAIAAWSQSLRFPVLIDDGTPEAAERIGQFVRAFTPAKVLRWSPTLPAFPMAPAQRFQEMERILALTMGVAEADAAKPGALDAALTRMVQATATPPGIVVVDTADASWAPALALAAGHNQPIVQFRYPYGPSGSVPEKEAAQIDSLAIATAERLKFEWKVLGDQIDAVTICANIPSKANTPRQGEFVALTDLVGRSPENPNARWAWAGQIYSPTTAQGVYVAMCALFLQPDSAWMFNGYESGKPWSDYAQRPAADVLESLKLRVTLTEFPDGSEKAWRSKARAGIDSSLVFVSSMGNADFFNLRPGQGKPGDIPLLHKPAAVYFIHSWSMTGPASRDTVGGRWLDRGAFAYFGSVQEPYLQAFITPEVFAQRLAVGVPWGAMFAIEERPAWRVGSIGDPLFTLSTQFGAEPARFKGDPALAAPLTPLADLMRQALKAGDLAGATRMLAMMGRDQDACDLFVAAAEAPDKVTPALCAAVISSCAHVGNSAAVVRAFDGLSPDAKKNGGFRDLLWFAAADPAVRPDSVLLGLLKANIRPEQQARDAAEAGQMRLPPPR